MRDAPSGPPRVVLAAVVVRGIAGLAVLAAGCVSQAATSTTPLRAPCAAPARWNGTTCATPGAAPDEIERGATALAAFDVATALPLLESAGQHGPLTHAQHVKLYEQLGVAYGYLGRDDDAARAFERLLWLEPGHLLSYTLSPKATFVFERVREARKDQPVPAVDVHWPRDLEVTRPLRLDVQVDADPGAQFARAALTIHPRGVARAQLAPIDLPRVGGFRSIRLPAPGGTRPTVLEVSLTVYDRAGNEVLRWGDPARPREMLVDYRPPTPWYRRWWVWAIAGTAVAASTGAIVFWATDEPSSTLGGTFRF